MADKFKLPVRIEPNETPSRLAHKTKLIIDRLVEFVDNINEKVESFDNIQVGAATLATDSDGNVTKPNNPVFTAQMSANQVGTGTIQTTFAMDTEIVDIGNNYNNSTYTFTAPVTGTYAFSFVVDIKETAATTNLSVFLSLSTSNRDYSITPDRTGFVTRRNAGFTFYADMDANDTAIVASQKALTSTGTLTYYAGGYFTGALLG